MISLNNLIPEPPYSNEYNNQLKLAMAKAAIREAVRIAIARYLISMTGLGESLREDADKEVKALFQPAKKTWYGICSQAAEFSPNEWYAEKDAFLMDDPTLSFFTHAVDILTEDLAKEWAQRENPRLLS